MGRKKKGTRAGAGLIVWGLTAFTLSALLLIGCATSDDPVSRGGKEPAWITDRESVYPSDTYMAELGEGDTLDGARASAAGSLVQVFSTRITVDSTVRTRYSQITGEGGELLGLLSQTDIDEKIGQESDQSLSNLKYGDAWISDLGRVYTVAYLDRMETGMLYRQRILDNNTRIRELRQRADSQDDPLRRFAFLDAALVSADMNRVLIEQLEIINNPMARSLLLDYDMGDLKNERDEQGRALRVRIEVFGDPEGRIGAMLTDWVTGRGFTASEQGDLFLSAMVALNTVDLNNDFENLSWELNLALLDFFGNPAVTLPAANRSSGISKTAAENRAWLDMSRTITRDFDRAFNAYLDSFLDK